MKGGGLVEVFEGASGPALAVVKDPHSVAPFWSSLGTGEGWPLAVYIGVDTLALYYEAAPLRPDFVERLDALKAQAETEPQLLECGPYTFQVMGHGAKGGFRWMLRSPAATALVKRDGSVHLTFRSVLLTALGPKVAVAELSTVVAHWRAPPHWGPYGAGQPTVSRIDLCSDIRAPAPSAQALDVMVSRARFRRAWSVAARERRDGSTGLTGGQIKRAMRRLSELETGGDIVEACEKMMRALGARVTKSDRGELLGDHETECAFSRGGDPTGLTVGKGEVMLRWYDKLREHKASGKGYMMPIWEAAGYSGGPISRVEFQFRKGGLDSFPPIRAKGRTWTAVSGLLGGLWAYATRSWVTMRTKGDSPQRTRWPVDPLWLQIQDIGWPSVGAMTRSSTSSPRAWVRQVIEHQQSLPEMGPVWSVPALGIETDTPASVSPVGRVAIETRRRGLHLDGMGHGVLREAEQASLASLEQGLSGYLASMVSMTGGRFGTPEGFARAAARRPGFKAQVRRAQARQVIRGAESLRLGAA